MPSRTDAQDARPDTNTTSAQRPVIDLREVCCGLVPAILSELATVQADEVDVLLRAGMETEIISGFGSGGSWQLCFQPSFGHGLARFTRRKANADFKVRLDTLDY